MGVYLNHQTSWVGVLYMTAAHKHKVHLLTIVCPALLIPAATKAGHYRLGGCDSCLDVMADPAKHEQRRHILDSCWSRSKCNLTCACRDVLTYPHSAQVATSWTAKPATSPAPTVRMTGVEQAEMTSMDEVSKNPAGTGSDMIAYTTGLLC